VPPRPLADLAALLGTRVDPDDLDPAPVLRGVCLDSRRVAPGDLYAALPGTHVHGARFSAQAGAAGAVAVLTDPTGVELARAAGLPVVAIGDPRARLGEVAAWIYGHPAEQLLMLGVTGTNGKTTTTFLADAGLRAAGHVTGLVGTVETHVAGEVLESERTTPEAPDLHALLALMVERGCTAAVMEVSSHALALGRVDGVVFDVAAFTNLSQDHLDFHPTIEDYYRAKASLFRPDRSRAGVVDVDDPSGRRLSKEALVPVTTFAAAGAPADWRAEEVESTALGSTFVAVGPAGRRVRFSVRLPGVFNVANALGAVVMLAVAGVPPASAAAGLAGLRGVPGRMERVEAGQPYLALVDYAHTPEAVQTLLATVRSLVPGRVILVLGCGGDRDPFKRPLMGAAAVRGADVAVFTNDNPRSEPPATILDAMVAGAREASTRAQLVVEPDRAAAIATAVAAAQPDDAVVVAGKGHERVQEVRGVAHPFDDRVELRRAIEAMAVAS
jgi:UDP-N-acetylmuramoyl-L-alanyl-D-glutamate--2,6-diaminopimelate ligase